MLKIKIDLESKKMKFREFKTSSGKLVLAGKNAENNEKLIAQVQPDEDVFHTEKPGSPFVNIKLSKNETASQNDIKESAIFCAAKSQDWRDNISDVKVNWFKGKDILKRKGMKIGTFEVKNKKIF